MSAPKLTPYLRDKIEDLLDANSAMTEAIADGVSDAGDEAVNRFDEAVYEVIIAARDAGFGSKQ